MNNRIRENTPLIIGLAIPILMILFVAGAIYFPRQFTTVDPPKYDFLYMIRRGYSDTAYSVRNGHLVKRKIKPPKGYNAGHREVKLFVHYVRENQSKEISFEEATKLRLESRRRSPNGFAILSGRRSGGFFPFYARWDYDTRYLKKEGYTEKLNLEDYYGFSFLGWIVG